MCSRFTLISLKPFNLSFPKPGSFREKILLLWLRGMTRTIANLDMKEVNVKSIGKSSSTKTFMSFFHSKSLSSNRKRQRRNLFIIHTRSLTKQTSFKYFTRFSITFSFHPTFHYPFFLNHKSVWITITKLLFRTRKMWKRRKVFHFHDDKMSKSKGSNAAVTILIISITSSYLRRWFRKPFQHHLPHWHHRQMETLKNSLLFISLPSSSCMLLFLSSPRLSQIGSLSLLYNNEFVFNKSKK